MIANGRSGVGVSARSVLGGLLIGGLVGSGIVLLKAPRSGADTRQMIRGKAEELQSKAEQTVNDTQSRVTDMAQQITDKAEELKSIGATTAEQVEKQARQAKHVVTEA